MHLFSLLLPFAINIIQSYIRNTDSKKDDLVLDIVKDSLGYLAVKDNNSVNIYDANSIIKREVHSNKKGGL